MTRHSQTSRRYRRSSPPRNTVQRLQEPLPTFTALLAAAQCVDTALSTRASPGEMMIEPFPTCSALLTAAQSAETTPSGRAPSIASETTASSTATPSALVRRRLRNRVSCRKTRLKRKLRQHALQMLAETREKRQQYLIQLADKLKLGAGVPSASSDRSRHHDVLFRDLAARSLHHALVDAEYDGWKDPSYVTPQTPSSATLAASSSVSTHISTGNKRENLKRDDASVLAVDTDPRSSAQVSLLQQWRPLVDGLQNVDLELLQSQERVLDAGSVEWSSHWRLVGVRSARVQRDGEITAVAISGTTVLRFRGRHVDAVQLFVLRREDDVTFSLHPSSSAQDDDNPSEQ